MTVSRFDRLLPLAGVLAGALFLVVNLLTWGAPEGADVDQVVAWGTAHETRATLVAVALAYLAVLLVLFAAAARSTVRAGEPGEASYSSVAFGGGLVLAFASASWSFLTFALTSAVTDDHPAAVETLVLLRSYAWLPWLIGSAVLFLGLGLGGLRTATLPRWLAWLTVALAVLALTGVGGTAVYFATPFWLMVTGGVLLGRQGGGTAVSRDATAVPVVG